MHNGTIDGGGKWNVEPDTTLQVVPLHKGEDDEVSFVLLKNLLNINS